MSMIVSLPWPEPALWPNSRPAWWALAQARKEAKRTGFFAALELGIKFGPFSAQLPVSVSFHPPTRRRFDVDNALAAMKGYFDGIAQALGIDDSCFSPITVYRGTVGKPGCVVVEIG